MILIPLVDSCPHFVHGSRGIYNNRGLNGNASLFFPISRLLLVHISLLPYLLFPMLLLLVYPVHIYICMYIYFLFHLKVYFRILNASSLCVFALAICPPPSTFFPSPKTPHNSKLDAVNRQLWLCLLNKYK